MDDVEDIELEAMPMGTPMKRKKRMSSIAGVVKAAAAMRDIAHHSSEFQVPALAGQPDDGDSDNYTSTTFPEEGKSMVLTAAMLQSVAREKDKHGKRVSELGWFLVFFTLVLLQMFLSRDVQGSFEMEHSLKDVLVDEEFPLSNIYKHYLMIGNDEEFWAWVYGPLLAVIGPQYWYDGNEKSGPDAGYIYSGNKIVGAVRFRQLRVKDYCPHSSDLLLSNVSGECHPGYGETVASRSDFGVDGYRGTKGFTWSSENEVQAQEEIGRHSYDEYGGDGFIFDVVRDNYNLTNVKSQIDHLVDGRWVDRQTRLIVVSLTVHNSNTNLFAMAKFLVEFSPGGYARPTYQIAAIRLELYAVTLDKIRMAIELLIAIFLIAFCWGEFTEIKEAKRHTGSYAAYYKDRWNWVDWCNLLVFWCVMFMILSFFFNKDRKDAVSMLQKSNNPSEYINVEHVADFYMLIFNLNAVNALLSFLKIFKFLQVAPRITVLWQTLGHAGADLVAFSVFFFIVFAGFATAGHLLFGPTVSSYRNFQESFMTCFQIILGQFDYSVIIRANRLLGPLYFVFFVVLVYFTLANMFLAIINDAYQIVHRKNAHLETVGELIQRGVAIRRKKLRLQLAAWRNEGKARDKVQQKKRDESILEKFREAVIPKDAVLSFDLVEKILPDSSEEDRERLMELCQNLTNRAVRVLSYKGLLSEGLQLVDDEAIEAQLREDFKRKDASSMFATERPEEDEESKLPPEATFDLPPPDPLPTSAHVKESTNVSEEVALARRIQVRQAHQLHRIEERLDKLVESLDRLTGRGRASTMDRPPFPLLRGQSAAAGLGQLAPKEQRPAEI